MLKNFRAQVRRLNGEVWALLLAARDPQTPWYAKLVIGGVVAYAISPIDLIPDFVPILGFVDDLILVPLGITLAIRLIPPQVLAECRERAHHVVRRAGAAGRRAAFVIVGIWLALAALCVRWAIEALAMKPS